MYVVRGWQLGSFGSLATETTCGEILVHFGPNMVSEAILDSRVHNFKNFHAWGACPQTHLASSGIKRMLIPHLNGRTSLNSLLRPDT